MPHALVTGANRGLGLEFTRQLLARGERVVATCRHPGRAIELVRLVATTRITFPRARVRLSAGRDRMSRELQILCFLAGANSIFFGDKLLTAPNPSADGDADLFRAMGISC